MGSTRLVLSRGLILEPARDPISSDLTPRPSPGRKGEYSVLLDNIRSAWNAGSIFRSADGFGFVHAYLCGITPTPESESVTKTSLGAEDSVPWSYHKNALKLVKGLKKEGFRILALEEDQRAVSINSAPTSLRSAASSRASQREVLMVGNEVTGIDPELLDLCDEILYIPMRGEKKSFNVAMAFSIAAYALTRP